VGAAADAGSSAERRVYSVTAVNKGIARRIAELGTVWVEGEVAELRRQEAWGIVFWTLNDLDGTASAKVQMFRTVYDRMPTPLVDGQRVLVLVQPQLREKTGELSLRALRAEPSGTGNLLVRLEELRRKLGAEGLFAAERKRALPRFPRVVGLVCGRDAAARSDVIETARRRFPPVRFRIVECAVQGAAAPGEVMAALRMLDADPEVDVIVLARGGGSLEDLAGFSSEELCRAIAATGTPVVSAIGHEQDTPLSDLVADVRASTPTHAGRLVVPDAEQLLAESAAAVSRARRALEALVARERASLTAVAARPVLLRPRGFLEWRTDGLRAVRNRLSGAQDRRLERDVATLAATAGRLRALGPGATLERGYAIALAATGAILRNADDVAAGDPVEVRLARGRLSTRVEEVHP
jgi:exodeoxyribonuclease VII large subunit